MFTEQMSNNKSSLLYIPLSVHFLLELSMWLWLLIASLLDDFFYILLLLITIVIFMGFKASNDPIKKSKFTVPGILILLLELFSFSLGIFACYVLFGLLGLIFQLLFTLTTYIINYQRVLWLLGLKTEIPETMNVFSQDKVV